MKTPITLLASLSLLAAACTSTPETREEVLPTDDRVDTTTPTDERVDVVTPAEDTPNTLLTGSSVGDFTLSGDYPLTLDGDRHSVELAPGVSGNSYDGKELCEIWVTSEEYRTKSGLGIGSKIGDFGTADVDLTYENASGLILSRREKLALNPHDYRENEGNINPDAVVTMIRLGGCPE